MSSVPRNFKLLDELEEAEKSSKGGADISLGLSRPDDTLMSDWQASLFTTAGRGGEPRLFFVTLHCDKDYPKAAPAIRFTSKVALECVDASGKVRASTGRRAGGRGGGGGGASAAGSAAEPVGLPCASRLEVRVGGAATRRAGSPRAAASIDPRFATLFQTHAPPHPARTRTHAGDRRQAAVPRELDAQQVHVRRAVGAQERHCDVHAHAAAGRAHVLRAGWWGPSGACIHASSEEQ